MNLEKFKKIEEIYHAALEVAPAKRSLFLEKKCGGNLELKREVESLLAFDDFGNSFIDSPPELLAAEILYGQRTENLTGETLAHYKILSLLGEGGMGAVYLAQDTKLLRRVALKILPPEMVKNQNRVHRFIHEARSASSLNHPHILTIYDIDKVENLHFMAMEFVDGETLQEEIYQGETDFETLIKYLTQTADGLAKAHSAGIVHRDLKPENIMVSSDGFAKILDFGLAKLVESETDLRKFQQHKSVKGAIMGTLGYMSPEQAQGKPEIDGRSDIFSFGCVLYEAAAKRKPFEAESTIDALYKIIHAEPPKIKGISADLQNIIDRCLKKNADERFQTIKEAAVRLRNPNVINAKAQTIDISEERTVLLELPNATKIISCSFSEQRRQATVLFADISALNEISEECEPEEAGEIINDLWARLETIIKENSGQAERQMSDTFIAFWGADAISEEDPERAIRTALDLQNETRKFIEKSKFLAELQSSSFVFEPFLKIGISTGTMLFGQSSDTGEFTATGAAMSAAKSLHQNAPPGTILISHDTYRHVRGVFDVAEFQLKQKYAFKKAESKKVYEIKRAKERAFRVGKRGVEGIETQFVGRTGELEKMLDALEAIREDNELQVVTVCGEAGLGKSRLLYEFINSIELMPEKFRVFKSRSTETMRGLPFSTLKDVFSFRFEIRDSDSGQTAREKLVKGILDLTAGASGAFSGEDAEMKMHFIGHLIGFDFSGSPHLKGVLDDEQQIRDRAQHYAAQFFQTAANQFPTVLFLDDLHWADEASLDFFQQTSQICRQCSFLILEFVRPLLFERRPHWGEGESNRLRLDLHPLTKRESRKLVKNILQKLAGGVPDKLRDLVVTNAEGNPFYVEELIKMLIEQRVVIVEADEWVLDKSRFGNVVVPPTLTGVLQARLDKLSVREKTVLQQASVVGREFWDKTIENFSAAGVNIKIVLESLRRKELLYRRQTTAFDAADEYMFKHALLRDVTYQTVLLNERRRLHEKTAEWLIKSCGERKNEYAATIAEHFENAENKEKSSIWFGLAGENARKTYASETAVEYFQKAIEFYDSGNKQDDFIKWHSGLGKSLMSLARFSEAVKAFEIMKTTAEKLDDKLSLIRAWHGLSTAELENGENKSALESAEKAVETAKRAGEDEKVLKESAFALYRLGRALLSFGKFSKVIELSEEALKITKKVGDAANSERGFCFHLLAAANMSLGRFEQALFYEEKELELTRRSGDKRTFGNGLNSLGEIYRLQGDGQQAVFYYKKALAIAREIGNKANEIMVLSNIGGAKSLLNDFVSAEKDLRRVISMTEKTGHFILPETYRFLAEVLLKQDKTDEAVKAAQKSLELSKEAENKENIAGAWRIIGLIAANLRKPVKIKGQIFTAADCYTKSLQIFTDIKMNSERARVLSDFADYENNSGNKNHARKMIDEAEELFVKLEMPLEARRTSLRK